MEYIVAALVAIVVIVFIRLTLERVTVFEYEQGLRYRGGREATGQQDRAFGQHYGERRPGE